MKKTYWIYGISLGLLLILLQVVEYKAMVRDLSLEWFGFIIGGLFLVIGVWMGTWLVNKKQQHRSNVNKGKELGMSSRELEVLGLMADGLSNQEIADGLFVSLNTVKTHISNIYMKLNVQRRTQAVDKARNLGLIGKS